MREGYRCSEISETYLTVTSVLTEFAMKQLSCAAWCIFSNSSAVGAFSSRPCDLRMQLHFRDRQFAFGVLLHVADRFVFVGIEDELLLTGDREKGEHVATGERRDERLFRIDVRRIAEISWCRGAGHGVAAIKAPGMIARIFLVARTRRRRVPNEEWLCVRTFFCIKRRSRTASDALVAVFPRAKPLCRHSHAPNENRSPSLQLRAW